jgi:hypothetical protein
MPFEVLGAHLLGSIAILIVLAQPFGNDPVVQDGSGEAEEKSSVAFVASYSAAVAIVMTIGVVLGDLWLKSDPTLILQASLMIILPSVLGTWTVAVDRMIGLLLGVVAGFYLGQVAGGQVMEIVVWISASFLLVTLMNVNAAPMVFFFVLPYSLVWGMLDAEAGHAIANERLWAELIGVILAGIAVSSRESLARMFSSPTSQ